MTKANLNTVAETKIVIIKSRIVKLKQRSKFNLNNTVCRIIFEDLKSPRLRLIYENKADEMVEAYKELKDKVSKAAFRHEVLIGFWLAVHLG
jgi:hypothetical protein